MKPYLQILRQSIIGIGCLVIIAMLVWHAIMNDPVLSGKVIQVITYHPNGNPAMVAHIYDMTIHKKLPTGKYHGLATHWDDNGRIVQATNWSYDSWDWNRSYDWDKHMVRMSKADNGIISVVEMPISAIEDEYRNPNRRPEGCTGRYTIGEPEIPIPALW